MMARLALPLLLLLALAGCTSVGVPEGLQPVSGFDADRYLGRWYEIARLDHSFERGLTNVTADYALRDDGAISVLNRGYNPKKREWEDAEGVARFLGPRDVASLKVSFFGPFYGGYHVLALDEDYQWSVVSGPDRGYFWILAREPQLPKETVDELVAKAKGWGFATDELIFVDQSPIAP